VTLVLEAEAVEAAGVTPEESVKVWFESGLGRWPMLRKRLRRADSSAEYVGTASARLRDGRFHLHLLLFTSLPVASLKETLHVEGLDVYVKSPRPNESADDFAARRSAYAFDNAARSESYRFMASRGDGLGYHSAEAKRRRMEALADSQTDGRRERGASASVGTNGRAGHPAEHSDRTPEKNRAAEAVEEAAESSDRAPPVGCNGAVVRSEGAYMQVVKRALSRRCVRGREMYRRERDVHVTGHGRARLLSVGVVKRKGEALVLTVHVRGESRTRDVSWQAVQYAEPPILRTVTPSPFQPPKPMSNESTESEKPAEESEGKSPAERFAEAARYSTVTVEKPDGTLVRTKKDHKTGEVTETVIPEEDRPDWM
jgi:hypothetical protein